MKKWRIGSLLTALLVSAGTLWGGNIMDKENWSPGNDKVHTPPKMEMIRSPYGPAVQITVQEAYPYQGVNYKLPEPVDLNNVGMISFRIKQNVYGKPQHGCLQLHYGAPGKGLITPFLIPMPGPDGWSEIKIPVDVRTLASLDKQGSPHLGTVTGGNFSLYSALRNPKQFMAIADFKFLPKQEGMQKIPVMNYTYATNKPTSGDQAGTLLTDGKVVEPGQAYFEQYTSDPEIVFDLGALYLVDKVEVSAVAVPSQNLFGYQIFTSKDNKDWRTAAHVSNTNLSGTKAAYTITGDKLGVIGRYIKIKPERSRTDFHIYLAEVSFYGKLPTDEELTAAAARSYDLGPAMSDNYERDYWEFTDGANTLRINKNNGVAVNYCRGGRKVAERIFGTYEIKDGKHAIGTTDYEAKVVKGGIHGNAFCVQFTLPKLPGIEFQREFTFADGTLSTTLKFVSKRTDKQIFYTSTQVVLPKDLRTDGLYETWGAGHDMQHKFANEIAFDFPADTGPVVVFEQPNQGTTLLHFRYKYNNEYVQIGSGTVTVAGVGDKRTIFTSNGWIIGDGLFQLTQPGICGIAESRLLIADGDLTAAFDKYLALPDVKAFRSQIKRASWLKDVRMEAGQGWEGFWGNGVERIAKFNASLIREGKIVFGFCDSDFYWGDFPTSGRILNEFGGEMTAEQVVERERKARAAADDKLKIYQYTWLWSASDTGETFKKHPEWFITKDANGREVSFFPGWGRNFYRQLTDPAAQQYVIDTITSFVKFYECEIWYLDGGGSPSSVNWPKMQIDAPNAWDKVYLAIRTDLQKHNPDSAVFFNHPENPLGDFGYLENNGGVMTSNWRDGATWMYKFKLWQRPEPLFTPLYIYWSPGVDSAFRQYVVGTGLGVVGGWADRRRDVPYISAQQQSRWVRLVDAKLTPNWRYEPKEMVEGMTLTFGPDGWVFLKNHDKADATRKVGMLLAPLGLVNEQAPVYHWSFDLKPFDQMTEVLTESDREASYRNSGWQTGFTVVPEFLGATAYTKRMEREFTVAPDRLKLWYVTQSPALVWSVDEMRVQLPVSKTLGVEVSGSMGAGAITVKANSERKTAETAVLLPEGKMASSVTVNGQETAFEPMVFGKTRMVRFVLPKGESTAEIKLADAAPAAGTYAVAVTPGAPGNAMFVKVTGSDPVIAEIFLNQDFVWSKLVTPKDGKAETEIGVPKTVTGGEYQVRLYDLSGKEVASANFKQAPGQPTVGRLVVLPAPPEMHSEAKLDTVLADRGIKLLNQAEGHQKGSAEVFFTPEQAALEFKLPPIYASNWNNTTAAYEAEVKRYVQIRLSGNFGWFGRQGPFSGIRNFTQRYGDGGSMAGLTFDFEGKDGYTVRSFAGIGVMNLPINSPNPIYWGTKKAPQHIFTVSAFVSGADGKDSETFWLDLAALGAPKDWTGKAWIGLCFANCNANRTMKVEILKSTDVLPDGVTAVEPFVLKGGVKPPAPPKEITLPKASSAIKIDGKLDDAAWKGAAEFKDFTLLANPTVKAPFTSVKMTTYNGKLYLGVTFREDRAEGFNGSPDKSCWYNDSIEIYFQKRNSQEAFFQYIFDVTGKSFARDYAGRVAGAAERDLAKPEFASVKSADGKTWTLEVAIPLANFGKGAAVSGFNFGRNRTLHGGAQTFSLAPGREYRNFGVNLIRW